jgi:hypothetical protein
MDDAFDRWSCSHCRGRRWVYSGRECAPCSCTYFNDIGLTEHLDLI